MLHQRDFPIHYSMLLMLLIGEIVYLIGIVFHIF